jgi:hypothetical protein
MLPNPTGLKAGVNDNETRSFTLVVSGIERVIEGLAKL